MSDQIYRMAFSFIKQESKAAARLLEEMEPAEVAEFLTNAPHPLAQEVLREMAPSACATVLLHAEISTAILWLTELSNNHVCAVLRHLDKTRQQELLNQLPLKRRTACQLLLTYKDDMLGAWVETDVPVFPADMSVEDALKRLKRKSFAEDRLILVVDDERRPVATLSFTVLLRSTKAITLESIAGPKPELINGAMTLSTALSHPVWQQQDVAAVVNRRRELIGVIWYSEIRRLLSSHAQLLEPAHAPAAGAAQDLIQAYSDSMRGLLDVVGKGIG
ncbi:MAG: CBS domain-containing protein [Pseudomonadota bacterium]|nr:CBS domain-containing protein [Pseudomonadota bacterium]